MQFLTIPELDEKEIVDIRDAKKAPEKAFRLLISVSEYKTANNIFDVKKLSETLAQFPNVQQLYLSDAGSDPFTVPSDLSALEHIQSICFDGSFGRFASLGSIVRSFSSLPNLHQLSFVSCGMTKEKFASCEFESFKNLENVKASYDYTSQYVLGSLLTQDVQAELGRHLKATLPNITLDLGVPFDDYAGFADFGSELPEKATDHIKDEKLKKLYWHLNFDPFRASQYGLKHLDEMSDKLAALEAVRFALQKLAKDYAKLVGFGWTEQQIESTIADVSQKIANLTKDGATSDVFSIYAKALGVHEKGISDAASEFVDDLDRDEEKE